MLPHFRPPGGTPPGGTTETIDTTIRDAVSGTDLRLCANFQPISFSSLGGDASEHRDRQTSSKLDILYYHSRNGDIVVSVRLNILYYHGRNSDTAVSVLSKCGRAVFTICMRVLHVYCVSLMFTTLVTFYCFL